MQYLWNFFVFLFFDGFQFANGKTPATPQFFISKEQSVDPVSQPDQDGTLEFAQALSKNKEHHHRIFYTLFTSHYSVIATKHQSLK